MDIKYPPPPKKIFPASFYLNLTADIINGGIIIAIIKYLKIFPKSSIFMASLFFIICLAIVFIIWFIEPTLEELRERLRYRWL